MELNKAELITETMNLLKQQRELKSKIKHVIDNHDNILIHITSHNPEMDYDTSFTIHDDSETYLEIIAITLEKHIDALEKELEDL